MSQQQTTVKFYGVFSSRWKSLACTPEGYFQWILTRDSADLVTPFMRVVIQTTRYNDIINLISQIQLFQVQNVKDIILFNNPKAILLDEWLLFHQNL